MDVLLYIDVSFDNNCSKRVIKPEINVFSNVMVFFRVVDTTHVDLVCNSSNNNFLSF